MFEGLRHSGPTAEDEQSGVPSRFISDVLTVDQITIWMLDNGSMVLVQFVSAAVAIGLLEPVCVCGDLPDAPSNLGRDEENPGACCHGRTATPRRSSSA